MSIYCAKCGKVEVRPDEVYCSFCSVVERRKKKGWIAYLLWFFLPLFCLHRYYLGSFRQAIGRGLAFIIAFSAIFLINRGEWLFFVVLLALSVWHLVDAFVFIPRALSRNERNVEEEARLEIEINKRGER